MRNLVLATLLALPAACAPGVEPITEGLGEPASPLSEAVMRFHLPSEGAPAWGEVPFPNELYARDGRPLVPAAFPNPRAGEPLFERAADLVGLRQGFCTTCNVTFAFSGELDAATLADSAYFIDLADGDEIPARYEWRNDEGILSMRPAHGNSLAPGRRYAAVVTSDVRGVDGLEVGLPAEVPRESLERLAELGLAADDLAAVTTFETDDPARLLRSVRRSIHGAAAPRVQVDRVYAGADLDELLGVPVSNQPGRDVPARDRAGEFGVRHETTEFVIAGRMRTSRFVSGEGTDLGTLDLADDGFPRALSTHDVPFILIVPRGADLSNLPVVVAQHGFSADRTTGLTFADTAGSAGWAVLAIDAYQHGDRAPSARDRKHSLRGDVEGADGFGDTNQLAVVSSVFGFAGVPQDMALSPEYALSAFVQFAADALSAIRFAREGEGAALATAAGVDTLAFDPERVVYLGNSMGAVVGLGVTAVEPDLAGAVLNVMPGSILDVFSESGEFRPLAERVFLPILGVETQFDEVERSMVFDPTADLYRWVLEPIDPLALARTRATQNVLVQLAGHDEVAPPGPSESVVMAAGFTRVSRYAGAMHGMAEMHEQLSEYETLQPLHRRAAPRNIINPIEEVHQEITSFLASVPAR